MKHCAKCGKQINRKSKLWCLACDPHVVAIESKSQILFIPSKKNLPNVAELELIRICELCDFDYAKPRVQSSYDLLVCFDGKNLSKVQIKSSFCINNKKNHIFSLRRTRHNSTGSKSTRYSKEDCDYFFLYDVEGNSWLIPFELLIGKGSVTPGLKYPGYKIILSISPSPLGT